MAEIRDFFIKSLDEAECGIKGMMLKLGEQLKNRDRPVWFQLQQQELRLQYYSFRYASFRYIYVVMFVVMTTYDCVCYYDSYGCVCCYHDSYGCVFLIIIIHLLFIVSSCILSVFS
jgi:hypothetical protein